jgi:tRNA A-37 threonylcarbamoyl transferase component Bud32
VELLVDETGHQIIEKCPVGEVEYHFYQQAANALTHAGVAVPKLLSADPELRRLRLEYIPVRLTRMTCPQMKYSLCSETYIDTLPVRNGFTTTMHGQICSSTLFCSWHRPTKVHDNFGVFDNAVMFCLVIRV